MQIVNVEMSKCQNVVFAQMSLGQFRFHVISLHTPHINLLLIYTLAFKTLAGILLYRYFFDKHPTPTPGFLIWEPAPGLILVRSITNCRQFFMRLSYY